MSSFFSNFQCVRICLSHYWLLCSPQHFRGVWASLQLPAPPRVLLLSPLLPQRPSFRHSHSGVAWQSLHFTCGEARYGKTPGKCVSCTAPLSEHWKQVINQHPSLHWNTKTTKQNKKACLATILSPFQYQCLVEGCGQKFRTSEYRKDHLISAHKYPPDFRFDKRKKDRG